MAFFGKRLFDDIEATRGLLSAPVAPAAPAGLLGASWDQFYQPYLNTGSYLDRPSDLNLELREGNAGELANLIGYSGATTTPTTYTQGGMNEGGETSFQASGNAYTPDFLKALEQYKFAQADPYRTAVIDQGGQNIGTFQSGDEESAFDKFAWTAVPLAIAAMGAGAFGGWVPGTEGAAASGGGAIGAGELAAPSFFQPGATFLGESVAAAPAMSSGLGASIGSLAPVASPSLLGSSFLGEALPSLTMGASQAAPSFFDAGSSFLGEQVPSAMPMTPDPLAPWSMQSAAPIEASFTAPAATGAPSFFDQGSQFLGEQVPAAQPMTADPLGSGSLAPQAPIEATYGAPAITPPASTPPTTGLDPMRQAELAGYQTNGSMPSSPAVASTGGGLLGQFGGTVADAAKWMKANPLLGKLLMSGATGLLSAAGSGSSSGAAQQDYGPAKQWGSPLQQGLLGNVQQTMPAAIQQRPAGLLAQGNANSGAWRFLGG